MALRFLSARNCRSAILVVAVMAALPAAAFAQNDPRVIPPKENKQKLPEAPSKLPKVGADRTRGLGFFFGGAEARARRGRRQTCRGEDLGAVDADAERHCRAADDAR